MNYTGSETDAQLLQLLKPYQTCLNAQNENTAGFVDAAHVFFNNIDNMKYVREAADQYGIPDCPQPNVGMNVYQFYWACYWFKTYPVPSNDPKNCTILKSLIAGISDSIENVKERSLPGGDLWQPGGQIGYLQLSSLSYRYNQLTSLQAQMDCSTEIVQQQQQDQVDILQQVGAQTAAATTSNNGKYIYYGIGGLMVIGALYLLFHKKKKGAVPVAAPATT